MNKILLYCGAVVNGIMCISFRAANAADWFVSSTHTIAVILLWMAIATHTKGDKR